VAPRTEVEDRCESPGAGTQAPGGRTTSLDGKRVGSKHWHGAAPATAMSHIAIQRALDGKMVEWMEKVTDEQYGT
jgi:hypothetical protein